MMVQPPDQSATVHPDLRPTAGAQSGPLQRALGIADPEILRRLLACPAARTRLDVHLDRQFGPLPDLTGPDGRMVWSFYQLGPDGLHQLSRILAVLINHAAVRATTKGDVLASAVAFCDAPDVIKAVRRADLPPIPSVPVMRVLQTDLLDQTAGRIFAHLLAMMPPPLLARLALRQKDGALLRPDTLPGGADTKAALHGYARIALALLPRPEDADATAKDT